MSEDRFDSKKKADYTKWAFAALVAIFAVLWLAREFDSADEETAASSATPSAEWTTAPEGGVPVDLPEARMTNAPTDAPSAEQVTDPDE